jgi:hypothetical protein
MGVDGLKLLKTHVERVPVFRLSAMLMKRKRVSKKPWRVPTRKVRGPESEVRRLNGRESAKVEGRGACWADDQLPA